MHNNSNLNEQNWHFLDYKADFVEFIREYGRLPYTDLKEPLKTYKEHRKLLAQKGGAAKSTDGAAAKLAEEKKTLIAEKEKLIEEKKKLLEAHKRELSEQQK